MAVMGNVTYAGRSCTFSIHSPSGLPNNPIVTLLEYTFDRDLSGNSSQRAGQDGLWLSQQFAGGAACELTMYVQADSQAVRDRAVNDLVAMFPIRGTARESLAKLTFDFADQSKSMYVRRSGAPEVTRKAGTMAEVVVTVLSPDPWLYGVEQSGTFVEITPDAPLVLPFTLPDTLAANPAGGTVQISPGGTQPSRGVVTIYGPRETPGVKNNATGEEITLSSVILVAGDVLEIDLDNHAARLNGAYRPVDITSTWFELAPYTTSELQLTGSSDASAGGQITWYDAFEV